MTMLFTVEIQIGERITKSRITAEDLTDLHEQIQRIFPGKKIVSIIGSASGFAPT